MSLSPAGEAGKKNLKSSQIQKFPKFWLEPFWLKAIVAQVVSVKPRQHVAIELFRIMVRILVLHGYNCTGESLQRDALWLQRVLPSVELICPTAPFPAEGWGKSWLQKNTIYCDGCDHRIIGKRGRYKCMHCDNYDLCLKCYEDRNALHEASHTFRFKHSECTQRAWEQTAEFVSHCWSEQGPFDGLAGYSQGASVAAGLAARVQRGANHPLPGLRFLLLGAASPRCFEPQGGALEDVSSLLSTPILLFSGERDRNVTIDDSTRLASLFVEPRMFAHSGGHWFVPRTTAAVESIVMFLKDCSENFEMPASWAQGHLVCAECGTWMESCSQKDRRKWCEPCWTSWRRDVAPTLIFE